MKKFLAAVCILGASFTLSACTAEGEGYKDQAPYASERTAGTPEAQPVAEQVFRASQVK